LEVLFVMHGIIPEDYGVLKACSSCVPARYAYWTHFVVACFVPFLASTDIISF